MRKTMIAAAFLACVAGCKSDEEKLGEAMQALGCSRSTAYEHLRRAAGRIEATGRLLRVPVEVWEHYVKENFSCSSTSAVTSGTAMPLSCATVASIGVSCSFSSKPCITPL